MSPSNPVHLPSLAETLCYAPRVLGFGTSGRRGDVLDLTQLEIYINARAELDYLQSLPPAAGGIVTGDCFYFAHDLRPSSTRFVPEQGNRGELAQAVEQAIADAGMRPVSLGAVPTPALAAYALARACGSMMITGSHIPFSRNGYKTNSSVGELLKRDEGPIATFVEKWRARLYQQPATDSLFDDNGRFKTGPRALATVDGAGAHEYLARYTDFIGGNALRGLRVLVFQHSAVGRDLLCVLLTLLGAEVTPVGRSDTFVPIDTEAIDVTTLENVTRMATQAGANGQRFDAVVSTDGDSDRPLLMGLNYQPDGQCQAQFYSGDRVGMVVAERLQPDAVVVPISCNDAIDRSPLARVLAPKTRIGSPYVIAGMEDACARGATRVCGWEANGGFLTGSPFTLDGRTLPALPTRDAFLPILIVLAEMARTRQPMAALFAALPQRFSAAGLLRECPRARSQAIVASFDGAPNSPPTAELSAYVARYFSTELGFECLTRIDYTDGVRMYFENGEVAHIRPSGNADELRIYAVADSQVRADAIVDAALLEPDGILPRLRDA